MEASDINGLIEFLRFPSVSADTQFKPHIEACADWLLQRFKRSGLDAEKLPSRGNPLVSARNDHKPGRKTVLIYGHYDVQPPDPLELWQTPPFEPAAQRALGKTFGRPIALIREGASILIIQSLKDILHLDSLLVGLMLSDANAHSPNENFPVENSEAGIRLNQELLEGIAELK